MGWKKPAASFNLDDLLAMMDRIKADTGAAPVPTKAKLRRAVPGRFYHAL